MFSCQFNLQGEILMWSFPPEIPGSFFVFDLAICASIANFLHVIRQNLMKGYIARERGVVVLSKGGAFPGTGV